MPLSDELWRPISWSCRGGFAAGRLPAPWPTEIFSMLCKGARAPPTWPTFSGWLEAGSLQMASRLPMLQSDWLVSDVSEEPDMLRSSPPADGQYDDEATEKDNGSKLWSTTLPIKHLQHTLWSYILLIFRSWFLIRFFILDTSGAALHYKWL